MTHVKIQDAYEVWNNNVIDDHELMEAIIKAVNPVLKPEIFDWREVKQKYLEYMIDNYDSTYLHLFEWLEKNYSGIAKPEPDENIKYTQCPECMNTDKDCDWRRRNKSLVVLWLR